MPISWKAILFRFCTCTFGFLALASCGQGIAIPASLPTVSGATSIANPDGTVVVTINGSGFTNGSTVTVNGTSCTQVHVVSSTQLTCVLPNGSIALVNIIITTLGGGSGGSTSLTSPLISSTATSAVDAGGGTDPVRDVWVNLPNALKNDGAFALLAVPHQDDYSDFLVLKGYFSSSAQTIPSSATVTGITMTCNWSGSATSGTPPNLHSLKLTDGTNFGTEKSTGETLPLSPPSVSQNYGGQNDMWGLSLSPAIVNSTNFGVQLQFSIGLSGAKTPQVDYCTLGVYFH